MQATRGGARACGSMYGDSEMQTWSSRRARSTSRPPTASRACSMLASPKAEPLVLDLDRVSMLDAQAAGMFVGLAERVERAGGRFAAVGREGHQFRCVGHLKPR